MGPKRYIGIEGLFCFLFYYTKKGGELYAPLP